MVYKSSNVFFVLIAVIFTSMLSSCNANVKVQASPVEDFDIERYMGTWYEIARTDFFFEKNMDYVTAEYSLNDDGSVKVSNTGYNTVKDKWKVANGKAKFALGKNTGLLKVAFFLPFYSDYNIIALDDEYKYALVAGKDTRYLWILGRTSTIPDDIKNEYLNIAKNAGYDTESLIWTKQ